MEFEINEMKKYRDRVTAGIVVFIPSFMKIYSFIQKFVRRVLDT